MALALGQSLLQLNKLLNELAFGQRVERVNTGEVFHVSFSKQCSCRTVRTIIFVIASLYTARSTPVYILDGIRSSLKRSRRLPRKISSTVLCSPSICSLFDSLKYWTKCSLCSERMFGRFRVAFWRCSEVRRLFINSWSHCELPCQF